MEKQNFITKKMREDLIEALEKWQLTDDEEILEKGKLKYDIFERFGTNKKCPKCGSQLLVSDIESYDYLCFECDENMFSFEVE